MNKIRITGGNPLSGSIHIAGAKNAALPLMTAALLSDKDVTLSNIPYLADITTMGELLTQHGMHLGMQDYAPGQRKITLNASHIHNLTAPYEIVRTMRASVLVLGPLLARYGQARVSLPGGCAIGTRPIDLHLHALEQMGAIIELEEGYVNATAKDGLSGAEISFDTVSVGATENTLMAATLARGTTIIHNAAREPEVGDLARLLVKMGAKIDGIDTDTLSIEGVETLGSAEHAVIADRIETGSYLVMAAITGSELTLSHAQAHTSAALIDKLKECGVEIHSGDDWIRVKGQTRITPCDIITQPYPAFPTDMQAQMMTLLCLADGSSSITEMIFENRYMHVPELNRMGADITVTGRTALVRGVESLRGAEVMATDLRASVSLVIAALAAEGETVIHRIYHLDRGYERLEEKLAKCGAEIERIR